MFLENRLEIYISTKLICMISKCNTQQECWRFDILSLYLQDFGLGSVIELRWDKAAQTQNPFVIWTPTTKDGSCGLAFWYMHSPLSNWRKYEGRLHGEWGCIYELLSQ